MGRLELIDPSKLAVISENGDTARTLEERFADAANVKDWGADPSRSASVNTDKILDAIADAQSESLVFDGGNWAMEGDQVVVPTSNTWLLGSRGKTFIQNTSATGDAITFANDPTNLTNTFLTGCGMVGIYTYRGSDTTAGAGVKLQRCSGFRSYDCGAGGHLHNFVVEGCVNTKFFNPFAFREALGDHAGSTHLKVDGIELSDASYFRGYTVWVEKPQFGDATLNYYSLVEIGATDNFVLLGGYVGGGKSQLLLKPSRAGQHIDAVNWSPAYADGVNVPSGTIGVSVDGNGMAGSMVRLFTSDGVKYGQLDQVCQITNYTETGSMAFGGDNEYFNIDKDAFYSDAPAMSLTTRGRVTTYGTEGSGYAAVNVVDGADLIDASGLVAKDAGVSGIGLKFRGTIDVAVYPNVVMIDVGTPIDDAGATITKRVGSGVSDGGLVREYKAHQPLFSASWASAFTATDEIDTYTEQVDKGGDFNVTTGRFTAPVAGTYGFSWSTGVHADVSSNITQLYKNGSTAGYGMAIAGTFNTQSSSTVYVDLAAGDYVSLFVTTGKTLADPLYNRFAGVLVV